MSLWGNKDSKTSANAAGTIQIFTNGNANGTGTSFTTQAAVGNFLHTATGNTDFVITAISNNTSMTVRAGISGGSVTAVGAGSAYFLSEKPKFVVYADSTGIAANTVYGVDTTEAGVSSGDGKKVAHAGWVVRKVGTGARAGRVQYETLVAMGSISGDAEDTVFPDS